MKIWKNKFLKQMIIAITLIFVLLNGIAPSQVYATKSKESFAWDIGEKVVHKVRTVGGFIGSTDLSGEREWLNFSNIPGNLLKEFTYFVVAIGDVLISAMQVTLLGDMLFWTSTLIGNKNDNLDDPNSWLYADQSDVDALEKGRTTERRDSMLMMAADGGLNTNLFGSWKVPNILYSPENIFSNKIAALDANYINPHKYTPVNDSGESQREATSFAESISPTIASWYRAFRNIAIVGLLSVLVYIGIRILIGTVTEKAKYKERLTDWFIALCLVFFMHFIMAGIMTISDKITDLLSQTINSGIIVSVDDGTIFRTTFTGFIRFSAQSDAWTEALGYGIMYITIVGITLRFTFIYMKRALYLAFFTMISPLVAITYPIDKAGDGKAQAFNMWIKEYFINAILQPVHLVLYCSLVGAAMTLVVQNPIYGIVALLFISTAEKWIKKMFKMDQATLTSTSLGDVAVLGSMLGMGKNILGGIGKTAAIAGLTIATGGAGAGAAALKEAGAAGIKTAAGAAAGAAGTAVEGAITGTGAEAEASAGGTIEDTVNAMPEPPSPQPQARQSEPLNTANLMSELDDDVANPMLIRASSGNQPKEQTDQERASEIHTANANTRTNRAVTPETVGGPNLDEASNAANTEQNPNREKYFSDHVKDRLVKKVAGDKEPIDELIDMAIKGAAGAVGAPLGAAGGFFAAGLTGDNKPILAGAMGGASLGAGIADVAISTGDTIFNNNVKVLVKDGNLQDADIIKNTAIAGKKGHWSEAKMLQIGKLAEAYPTLSKGTSKEMEDTKRQIKEILSSQGVAETKQNQLIQEIKSVQTKVNTSENDKVTKELKRYQNGK